MEIGTAKIIVISAINLFEGGPLSILNDCVRELSKGKYINYNIKILVHSINVVRQYQSSNIEFIEFPKSRKSYIYRFFYEYYYFYQLSKKWDVYFWLSLHDMSPIVKASKQAVYCDNPSIFRRVSFKDVYLQPTLFLFSLFYRFIYKINIKANKYIVLQSSWMKDAFSALFSISKDNIIIAKPTIILDNLVKIPQKKINNALKTFFYPAFPRSFKNFEVIGEACEILNQRNISNFEIYLTLNGKENRYSKFIFNKYKHLPSIKFIGLLNREEVFSLYAKASVLIFPSTLETWGLPISEFKFYGKPMLLANLPYAHETVGEYNKVNFFNPNNALELANLIDSHIKGSIKMCTTNEVAISDPFAKDWAQLFNVLLSS